MEHIARVSRYLGGARSIGSPKNTSDFVTMIRKGLPFSAFTALQDRAQLSEDLICSSLRIAKRTAARRREKAERLKPLESELLLRLARLLATAEEVLGDDAKARDWVLANNRSLGGSIPIELLDTGLGFHQVMDVLGRLEHGVFS